MTNAVPMELAADFIIFYDGRESFNKYDIKIWSERITLSKSPFQVYIADTIPIKNNMIFNNRDTHHHPRYPLGAETQLT